MRYKICFFVHAFFSFLFVHARQPIEGKVETVNGRPSLVINGKAMNPMIYALTDVPGGRWSWEELPRNNLQTFYKAGFRLIQVDLFFDHVWNEDGSIDMTITQKQLRGVLDVCPEAILFIRFHVNPPKWWQTKYPEENTVYADSKAKPDYAWGLQRIIEDDEENPVRFSLASKKWIDESTDKLKLFLDKLARLPEGNAVAGIQVAGGVYGEWHYWGFIENEPDMSEPMKDYFIQWLRGKYKNDKELQRAWNDNKINFANTTLPSLEERTKTLAGIFRDPVKERKIIDYYEAQHTCVADDIIHFCKVVKHTWPRPIITGAFYGYYYAVFGREAAGGHLELQRVLNSPYVDYISAPGTYYPDAVSPGDAYRSRSLITSVRLHNKVWLDEMDQQPPLVPLKDTSFHTSVQKSIGMVRRNVLSTFVQGAGLWFYDFGPSGFNGGKRLADHGSWGWWDEPALMKDIANLKNVLDAKFAKPFSRDADVLLIHDTKSFYYTGSSRMSSYLGHWANNWIPPSIYKSGVVHDVIHIDDLGLIDADQYKAFVFVNTWTLNDVQKNIIKKKIASNGRHLIFLYAPGYCNEKTLDKKFIEDVTGMSVAAEVDTTARTISVTENSLGKDKISVWNRSVNPFFIVTDKNAEALGVVEGTTKVAFARKKLFNHTSWYIALPPNQVDLWRNIFMQTGAHIYVDKGDVIYSGSGILTLHTGPGGTRNVRLKNGVTRKIYLKPFSTTLLDSNTGDVLLP